MSFTFLDDAGAAADLSNRLRSESRIALDCEAAGFHRYSDRLCLVQISTRDETFVVDSLAFDPTDLLRPLLEDPDIEILMHGADFDVRLLDRDLGLRIRGLFDTQVAAALLGESALGLQSLLENHLDVRLSKKYQRADWAKRPLPPEMLEYAAADTAHLHELSDLLRARLVERGRLDWAEEEFQDLEEVRWEDDGEEEDPVTRVKGARDLAPRDVTALREALAWRDRVARELDRAPFRVAGDSTLLAAIRERPASVRQLEDIQGLNGRLARAEGEALIQRLEAVEQLGEDDLVPYPPPVRNGPGRPPPEVEETMYRLKSVRNRRAEELGIDRGVLISNGMLMEIARHAPGSMTELEGVPGMKRWQVDVLGEDLLAKMDG